MPLLELPHDLQSFLLLLIAAPVFLGAISTAILQGVFQWWEGDHWHAPIRSHDKGLVSAFLPPLLAALGYGIAVALGFLVGSWPDFAQTVFTGMLASWGSQPLYNGLKKLVSPPPSPPLPVPPSPYMQDADRTPPP